MKLYWCPQTRSSRAVWMLEEAGVDYELVHCDITKPERTPEHLAASPMGKVPALEDGEVKMWDSAAICLYVADRYASGRLAPALDDPLRARFVHWLIYSAAMIEPAMFESGLRTVVPEEHQAEAFHLRPTGLGQLRQDDRGLGTGPGRWPVDSRRRVQRRRRDARQQRRLPAHVRNAAGVAGARGLRRPLHGQAGVPEGPGGGGSRLSNR